MVPKPIKQKKVKKPKAKKPLKKRLEVDCFRLWSACIKARDKTCRYNNSDYKLSAHHIRSRTHHSTRFDLSNGICLSWSVHFLQKANPERFQDMVIEIIGDEKYQELKRKSLVIVDQTTADLEEIKNYLTKQLDIIKSGNDYNLL